MRQYLMEMINEGWQMESVQKEGLLFGLIEVTFSHWNKYKVPTFGWMYDKDKSYFAEGKIYIKAKILENLLSEEAKLKLRWYNNKGCIINPITSKFNTYFKDLPSLNMNENNPEKKSTTMKTDETEDPTLKNDVNSSPSIQTHQEREKFNKRLAKANIENQIKRDIVTRAGNLGYYVPFIPTVVK